VILFIGEVIISEIPFNLSNFKSYYNKDSKIKKENFEELKKYEWECNENQLNAIKMYTLDYQSYINSYLRLNPYPFKEISIFNMNLTYDEFLNLCNELDKICSIIVLDINFLSNVFF
jgi:hypothetical protein